MRDELVLLVAAILAAILARMIGVDRKKK